MNEKKLKPEVSSLPRNFTPGQWLVEPKDEYTHDLIASRFGEEECYKEVKITGLSSLIPAMWEDKNGLVDYLRSCSSAEVKYQTYRVSSRGYPIPRDYPRPSLKL